MKWVMYTMVLSLLFLTGCGEEPEMSEEIVIGAYGGDLSTLVFAARDYGFFHEQGLNVTIRSYPSGAAALDALKSGDVDIATVADFPIVVNAFSDQNVTVITSIARESGLNKLVIRDSLDNAVSGLKNNRIGVVRSSASEFFLREYLLLNKIQPNETFLIYPNIQRVQEWLMDGTLYAGVLWEPLATETANSINVSTSVISIQQGRHAYFLLVTEKEWLKSHAEETEKMMKALIRAQEMAEAQPSAINDYMQRLFDLPESYITNIRPVVSLRVEMPQSMLENFDDQAFFLIEQKAVNASQPPNFLELVNTSPLRKADISRVTLIE